MIDVLMQNAGETWFPTGATQTYGIFAGAFGGAIAGVFGGLAGILSRQGKSRGLVLVSMWVFLVFGVVNLGIGIASLLGGQPYAVWYPFLLLGVVFTLVMGGVIPSLRRVYRTAELRKLEAAELREG